MVDLVAGSLPPMAGREFELHRSGCDDCQAGVQGYADVIDLVRMAYGRPGRTSVSGFHGSGIEPRRILIEADSESLAPQTLEQLTRTVLDKLVIRGLVHDTNPSLYFG